MVLGLVQHTDVGKESGEKMESTTGGKNMDSKTGGENKNSAGGEVMVN